MYVRICVLVYCQIYFKISDIYFTLNRTKEANNRLRKLLHEERRSLQQVRENYTKELRARTELEMLLRQCVDDVRAEISKRYKK